MAELLARDLAAETEAAAANQLMLAYSGAQLKSLCVQTGREAMCLLLSSERVYTDLLLALTCAESDPEDQWATFLALRDWDETLQHDREFRCFISNGRMTAISQYNHYIWSPDLRCARSAIQACPIFFSACPPILVYQATPSCLS